MTAIGRLRGVVLLAVLLALAGCKKPKATQAPADEGPSKEDIRRGIGKMLPSVQRGSAGLDLQNIAKLYAADALGGTSPKSVEAFRDLDARTVKLVKDGEYVVLWGAPANVSMNAVVAYEKEVPTQGGMVATLGGTVTRMTPAEFNAAPKASGR